ncbi:MAG: HD domain-containing protein [Anaerolineales bacterium]
MSRWIYRVRQFFEALLATPTPADLELVRQTLTPAQSALFSRLQPSEQAHAVRVLRQVWAVCRKEGFDPPVDLQVAALLHDVGKARFPLSVWERVVIVLGKAFVPDAAMRWGTPPQGSAAPRGWKRPFVIAAQHPAWGAEMAAEQDTSPGAAALIRRHQTSPSTGTSEEDRLLAILQSVDDKN